MPRIQFPTFDEQYVQMCKNAIEIQDGYLSRIPSADDILVRNK
jgi:hypothetical protein